MFSVSEPADQQLCCDRTVSLPQTHVKQASLSIDNIILSQGCKSVKFFSLNNCCFCSVLSILISSLSLRVKSLKCAFACNGNLYRLIKYYLVCSQDNQQKESITVTLVLFIHLNAFVFRNLHTICSQHEDMMLVCDPQE